MWVSARAGPVQARATSRAAARWLWARSPSPSRSAAAASARVVEVIDLVKREGLTRFAIDVEHAEEGAGG